MIPQTELTLVARVRRLAADGAVLYIQLGAADIRRLGLTHGQRLQVAVGSVSVTGIVKTSGGAAWLAPGDSSNAEITRTLRSAGFEHGDDMPAIGRLLEPPAALSAPQLPASTGRRPPSVATHPSDLRLDPNTAARAVRAYNSGRYRGRSNLDVDAAAYTRFRIGLPRDRATLIDAIRFVGEDYGGAQARFLPHGYTEEAALIAANLFRRIDEYTALVMNALPLMDVIPPKEIIASLLQPFTGTKRWPVWATKTLHFIRPDVFPILDSRAKDALGLANLGGSPAEYHRFCSAIRATIERNGAALDAARLADEGTSPSVLKLLDKILYQVGGSATGALAPSA